MLRLVICCCERIHRWLPSRYEAVLLAVLIAILSIGLSSLVQYLVQYRNSASVLADSSIHPRGLPPCNPKCLLLHQRMLPAPAASHAHTQNPIVGKTLNPKSRALRVEQSKVNSRRNLGTMPSAMLWLLQRCRLLAGGLGFGFRVWGSEYQQHGIFSI